MKTQKSSPLVTYSNWIQWGVVIILGGLAAFFYLTLDVRYATKAEVTRKEQQLHEIRMADINEINTHISKTTDKAEANNILINRIDNKMSRIEAQNEMIINAVENLTYQQRKQDNK